MLQNILKPAELAAPSSLHDLYPGFHWGICASPIRYRHRWHRDLLIRAVLDPAIDAVEPDIATTGSCFSFVIRAGSSRVRIVAVHDGDAEPPPDATLPTVRVTRSAVRSDPATSTARAVWAARHHPLSAADQIRVLAGFEHAPERYLSELAALVREPSHGVDVVLAMICSGALSTSVSDGVGPHMKVRKRGPTAKERLHPCR